MLSCDCQDGWLSQVGAAALRAGGGCFQRLAPVAAGDAGAACACRLGQRLLAVISKPQLRTCLLRLPCALSRRRGAPRRSQGPGPPRPTRRTPSCASRGVDMQVPRSAGRVGHPRVKQPGAPTGLLRGRVPVAGPGSGYRWRAHQPARRPFPACGLSGADHAVARCRSPSPAMELIFWHLLGRAGVVDEMLRPGVLADPAHSRQCRPTAANFLDLLQVALKLRPAGEGSQPRGGPSRGPSSCATAGLRWRATVVSPSYRCASTPVRVVLPPGDVGVACSSAARPAVDRAPAGPATSLAPPCRWA